jgi:molybdopterin-guanine dinucleotide biosynthesis protein B
MAAPSPDKSPERKPEYAAIPQVVSFVSWSGVGKTTFLEKLVPELKQVGLRVGVLKHHAHATGFDVPGKDTYRLSEAGADIVVGASPVQTAVFIPGNASADLEAVIRRHLMAVDLILLEGYKRGHYRKIEVYRSDRDGKDSAEDRLLCDVNELLAVVTDVKLDLPETISQFDLDDPAGVARLLASLILPR